MDNRERRKKTSSTNRDEERRAPRSTASRDGAKKTSQDPERRRRKTSSSNATSANRQNASSQGAPRKRRPRPQEEELEIYSGNVAKSSPASRKHASKRKTTSDGRRSTDENTGKSYHRGRQTAEQRSNIKSKRIGMILATIQAIASLVFAVAIIKLNMLPVSYVAIILVLLVLLDGLLLAGQYFSKKNAIAGKIISAVLTIALLVGAFYIFRVSGTLSSITGGDTKVDHMVVAVMDEDAAETLEDAADYTFGAQFSMDGDDVTDAITGIEEELGQEINVVEYDDMQALATALQSGEVGAIIYNEAHSSFIEDENTTFATDIRIIYTYEIAKELSLADTEAANIEVTDESFIVYISGIDVYGDITKNSRSDVNMLAVINPTTEQILLVNTPRDYYVSFPGVTGDSKDKLTHAGIYGVDTSMETLEELYDIDIDFYARVNFTSLIEMVDALGGISVYSEYAFTSTLHAGLYTLYVQQGYNDFDGTDALIFARERYNVPGGDDQRGINQQEVIKAMIDKATSPAIITSANSLLSSVSGNVDTNMTDAQIQDLLKLQIANNIDWDITSVSATGTGSSAYCYSYSGSTLYVTIPDYDSVDAVTEQIYEVLGNTGAEEVEEETSESAEIIVE